MKLKQTKQCATCPWVVGSRKRDIPGYDIDWHRDLSRTIAESPEASIDHKRVMSCHHSKTGAETYCIGWLVNQLGSGNNIGMRMRMRGCVNADEIECVGEQHESFRHTFD